MCVWGWCLFSIFQFQNTICKDEDVFVGVSAFLEGEGEGGMEVLVAEYLWLYSSRIAFTLIHPPPPHHTPNSPPSSMPSFTQRTSPHHPPHLPLTHLPPLPLHTHSRRSQTSTPVPLRSPAKARALDERRRALRAKIFKISVLQKK